MSIKSPQFLITQSRRRNTRPLQQHRTVAEIHWKLGIALALREDWQPAAIELRKAIALDKDWLEPQRELGRVLVQLEAWDEAVEVLGGVAAQSPEDSQTRHLLGDALSKLEQWSEAAQAYQNAIALEPEFSWSHNNLGDALLKLERWNEAADAYQNAIALDSEFSWSYNNLGDALLRLERWDEAVEAYRSAIELDPNFAWSHYNLGDVLAKQEDWERAIAAYRSAVKIDPNLPQVHEKLGEALRNQIQISSEEISQVYHRAIKDNPTDLQLYYKALEVNPKDAEISLKLADVLKEQGKIEQAITFYKSTLQIDSNNHEIQAVAWHRLGDIFKQLGRLQEAIKAYQQVVELKPEWAGSHFNLIRVLRQLGRLQEAEKAGNRAVKIEPRLANFYRNWGVIKGDILAVDTAHQLGKRPQVAVCSWELAHNSAGRAYTLAQLYQAIADVEMIGSIFPNYGRELWEPIRKTSIPCHSFIVEDESQFVEQAMNLVLSHPYDVVHLSKPRMPNILFGLLYKLVWGTRVIVDIDDEELAFVQAETPIELEEFLKSKGQLPELKNLTGQEWTQIAVGLVKEFDAVTVSNPALQKRYGGEIIRHARDEKLFEPSSERRYQSRERLGISQEQKVVLFFGTPREHKGLLATAKALATLGRQDVVFMIVGDFPDPSLKEKLQAIQGVNYLFLGNQPFNQIPDVVAVGDICILLPDGQSPVSQFQIPAKLSDALGVGLTVLLSQSVAVTDVIESGALLQISESNLGVALGRVLSDEAEIQRLGSKARELFVAEFSYAKNGSRLGLVLGRVIARSTNQGLLSDRLDLLLEGLPSVSSVFSGWGEQKVKSQVLRQVDQGVSVIVLSLNGATLLDRLLSTFFATNTYFPVELIIIDHGSEDNTAEVVRKQAIKGDIRYVNRGENFSFSDSCNYGASLAKYPYLLFLNNDIVFTDDVLPLAVDKLYDSSIGAVGVRLDDDPSSLPKGKEAGVQHTGIHFVWNEKRGYFQPEQIRHESLSNYWVSSQVGGDFFPAAVTGAFLLCRKVEFEWLGGFSLDYDYGLEDIDFCLRLGRDLQKKCYCINQVSLQHWEGATRKLGNGQVRAQILDKNHRVFKQSWDNYVLQLIGKPRVQIDSASVNVLFVLYESLESNSGYQAQLHAARLVEQGVDCVFAVPDGADEVRQTSSHRLNPISVLTFSAVIAPHTRFPFADGRSPDVIYAWTPREVVRKFVEKLLDRHASALIIHLEDNEEYLTEAKLGRSFAELVNLPEADLDRLIPANRYHPIKGRAFLDRAQGLTMITDTLKGFNTQQVAELVLPAPVDEKLFYPRPMNLDLRCSLGIPEGHLVLAYTGNVHSGNRDEVQELYRAVEILNLRGCPTVLLRTGLNDQKLGVESWGGAYEKYLGWVERDQVPEILAAADILVQPGCTGLFNDQRVPSKLPEYFAMGRPVVLPMANMGLLVEHGQEGYVLERADAENICNAVSEIYGNKELANKLSKNAIVFLRKYIDEHQNNFLEFICSHIASKKYNVEVLSLDELINIYKMLKNPPLNIDSFETMIDITKQVKNNSDYLNLTQIVISNIKIINNCNNSVEKVFLKKENSRILDKIEREMAKRNLTQENTENSIEDLSKNNPTQSQEYTLENAIINVYKVVLNRMPLQSEIEEWLNNILNGLKFEDFFNIILNCDEAKQIKSSIQQSDGEFIKYAYRTMLNRGCNAREMYLWEKELANGRISRQDVLKLIFQDAVKLLIDERPSVHDGLSCNIMGTSQYISMKDWIKKSYSNQKVDSVQTKYCNRFHIISEKKYLVTAIASLYCGRDYIDKFMDNITTQSCFKDYCELIIIDANSPENESQVIQRYMNSYKNINYMRMNYRIGIYDAWNCGVKVAKGEYLTNTNLDDLRRQDSLEIQAGVLDNLDFVDLVYQDFYYTFDINLPYEEIALYDYQSNLPVVTKDNMMSFNSPHNAPMWRKKLHEEIGYFNINYKSAGDYDFWMRCLNAGKIFYKVNDPHVVYFQNPKGLSTSSDSRGVVESNEISKRFCKIFISDMLTMPFNEFCSKIGIADSLDDGSLNRYTMAKYALRNIARYNKF
ncbi:tetratricopeptide repeat protein [Limnospira platensis]|uniref:tetratricopeptide repeat protein n=1 Tax=Limnospira platensis TaxID=118562 RepID=UPI003D6E754B